MKIGAKCMFVFMFAKCNFGYSGMWNFIFGTRNTNIIISLLSNLFKDTSATFKGASAILENAIPYRLYGIAYTIGKAFYRWHRWLQIDQE